ncbi:hypothetical protein PM10SUCC1_32430 [Propionigenium maris DSM 9537]|uniref:Uncharacterized protein n=1 Tax=Propionigenium maris DSM 9537 TaxID=1123000 RepID=A0A9W6GMC3_9FUSO|nr:hypothetical protein [Propionigenium maris]GLI57729.1 hypothetical protein PM10SUCC1_32430 [Propionigenium maris DSM 9537]
MKKIFIKSGVKANLTVPQAKMVIPFGAHTVEVSEDQIQSLEEWLKNPSIKRRVAKKEIEVRFEEISKEELNSEGLKLQEKEQLEETFKEKYGYISALAGEELEALYEEILGSKPGNRTDETRKDEIVKHLREKEGL